MRCDVCSTSGTGTIVPAKKFSEAVRAGFNPFYNGCMPKAMVRLAAPGYPERWAQSAISGDTSQSDWNVCGNCMAALEPYFLQTSAKREAGGIKEEECWFCSHRSPAEQSRITLRLRKKLNMGKTETLRIPRCSKCQRVHQIAHAAGVGVGIATWLGIVIAFGIVGGGTGVFAGAIGVGPIPAFLLNRFCNMAITRIFGVRRIVFSGLNKHPLFHEKIEDGWIIDDRFFKEKEEPGCQAQANGTNIPSITIPSTLQATETTQAPDVGRNASKKMSPRPTQDAVYCPLCARQMPQVAWSIFFCNSCQIAFAGLFGNYSTNDASVADKCRNSGYTIIEKKNEKGTEYIIDC